MQRVPPSTQSPRIGTWRSHHVTPLNLRRCPLAQGHRSSHVCHAGDSWKGGAGGDKFNWGNQDSGLGGSGAGKDDDFDIEEIFRKDASAGGSPEVQDALADLMQMEVRRQQVKDDIISDVESRKEDLRKIGEEIREALAREYELDKMRTEMASNYYVSEALSQLDDVEADVRRIKEQVQADKADLAAFEARNAAERSRGLFFKSLYEIKPDKQQDKGAKGSDDEGDDAGAGPRAGVRPAGPAQPLPRGGSPAPPAPAGPSAFSFLGGERAGASSTSQSPPADGPGRGSDSGSGDSGRWWGVVDPFGGDSAALKERILAARERTARGALSAASAEVRSPLRLYLLSYLAGFLGLMIVADLAGESPSPAQDVLYGLLAAGLAYVALGERAAMQAAQEAMIQDIVRRRGRSSGDSLD